VPEGSVLTNQSIVRSVIFWIDRFRYRNCMLFGDMFNSS